MGTVIDAVGEEGVGGSEMEGLDPVGVQDTRGAPTGTQGKNKDMEGDEEEEEEEEAEAANIHLI